MDYMKPKISVIMPSLNVGEYIEKCICSVINQSLKEIEIICIDSGSTDKTLEILEKYSKQDQRIKLIKTDKKSYGYQVNLGLKEAKGEYISIVETDDYISEDMLKSLYNMSENSKVDIIKGTFNYVDSSKNDLVIKTDNIKSRLLHNKSFKLEDNPLFIEGHPSIWAGIYNLNFLKSNKILFKEEKGGAWVDNPFFYETALCADKIKYVHKPFYFYRVDNPNSSSNSLNEIVPMKRVLDIFDIMERYHPNENIWISFYNRLFRYVEIIIEHNNNSDENLSYEVCEYIHRVIERVDNSLVKKLKFNFQKLYYKYSSPLFMLRFEEESLLSKNDINQILEENKFLHINLTNYRNNFNDINYKYDKLEKELLNNNKLKEENESLKIQVHNLKLRSTNTDLYKISIIMPIYNGSKYLDKSMKSILNQTLDDIEIVFINDGSTDDTLKILEDFQKKYAGITILNQNNLGSGKARNYGIREAKGEYIAFLDADDFFMDADALERMYAVAKKHDADMVTANIKHDLDEKNNFKPFGPFHYYKKESKILPEEYGIPWSFYKNIFKKDFLINENIFFPDLLRGQDPVFLAEVLTKVSEIYAVPVDLYAYVYNSDVAKSNNHRKLYDQIMHYKMVCDYLSDTKFIKRKTEYYLKLFLFVGRLNDEDSIDALNCVQDIFKDEPSFITRMTNFLYLKYKNNLEMSLNFSNHEYITVFINNNSLENNLETTLNSLNNQTIKNFEIICINSEENFSVKNNNVIQTNINDLDELLKISNGNYLYFINSGDYLAENALEALFENSVLNGSDIVICNTKLYSNNANISQEIFGLDVKNEFKGKDERWLSFDNKVIKKHIFVNNNYIYNKFYSRKFFLNNNISYNFLEPYWKINIESLLSAKKISVTKKLLIYHKVSNIHKDFKNLQNKFEFLSDYKNNIIENLKTLENFLKKRGLYDEYKYDYIHFSIIILMDYLDVSRFKNYNTYVPIDQRTAEPKKHLNYSKYYGSNSEFIGLSYDYSESLFEEIKEFFIDRKFYEDDIDFIEELYKDGYISKLRKFSTSNSYLNYKRDITLSNNEIYKENIGLKSENKSLNNLIKQKDLYMTDNLIKTLKKNISKMNIQIQEIINQNKSLKNENNEIIKEINTLNKFNNELKNSNSWKITKILRRN